MVNRKTPPRASGLPKFETMTEAVIWLRFDKSGKKLSEASIVRKLGITAARVCQIVRAERRAREAPRIANVTNTEKPLDYAEMKRLKEKAILAELSFTEAEDAKVDIEKRGAKVRR